MFYTYYKQFNKFSRVYSYPLITYENFAYQIILNLRTKSWTQQNYWARNVLSYCNLIGSDQVADQYGETGSQISYRSLSVKGETVKSLGSTCTCVLRDLILKKEPCLGFWQNAYLFTTLRIHFANIIYRFILFFRYLLIYIFPFLLCTKWTLDHFIENMNICIGFQNLNC